MSTESSVLDFLWSHLVTPEELFGQDEVAPSGASDEEPTIEPLKTESFEDLIAVCKDNGLFVPKSFEDTLAVMLATTISTYIGGDERLWFYVMGPPSAGKSVLCSMVSADLKRCEAIDKFTGFLSGYKQGKSKKDFGLIQDINHKTVVIKDFTSVLSQPLVIQEKIFGELRFLSDGTAKTKYLQGQHHNYHNVRFSMLCGVTDEILRLNHSGLGERFLMVDLTDKQHGSQQHVKQALTSIAGSMLASFPQKPLDGEEDSEPVIPPDRLMKVRQHTLGFMQYIHKRFQHIAPPEIPENIIDYCTSIGRFVGIVRGQVKREGVGRDLLYVPRPEIGVRLGGQLLKTALALSVVFQNRRIGTRELKIVRKVSRDTARGYNFEIVKQISISMQQGGVGMDKETIADRLDISPSDVMRRLNDLRALKLLTRVSRNNNSGRGGRNRHYWQLLPEYMQQWEHLNGKLKQNNVDEQ